jgi:hypothetical protein
MTGAAPLVMILDEETSTIPWEMVAQPDPIELPTPREDGPGRGDPARALSFFIGTHRGLTRQLQSMFSSPPEPLPASRDRLRVLVVANPAADAPLKWAETEGAEVAELFRRFNEVHGPETGYHIEVSELLGPGEADLEVVLRELTLGHYDVLHFAGHCVFNEKDPSRSGWLFSDGAIISANELTPIDRIPKFVFSNACESGRIPRHRSTRMAPSFAESFFARGVSNFVCTAWPVADGPARRFATVLYSTLLDLPGLEEGMNGSEASEDPERAPFEGKAMYEAMRAARQAVYAMEGGLRTWGAYQHYGNPFYRFFPRKVARAHSL